MCAPLVLLHWMDKLAVIEFTPRESPFRKADLEARLEKKGRPICSAGKIDVSTDLCS